jgi:6-phosphofructokinase 1
MKRIGILTGGGDVPGLNPAIKALVYDAVEEGYEAIGIRKGWGGLLYCNPDDPSTHAEYVVPLDKNKVRTIDRSGGTWLHSSRTNPGRVREKDLPEFLAGRFEPDASGRYDCTPHALDVLRKFGIDTLVPIGGDDTLSYAYRLHEEGFQVVAIPKTMDNDVYGTDYCIGFSTAVSRSVEFIHQLRSSAGSHERICIVELFGRNSGETSLMTAYLARVDRAIISEVPFDPVRLGELLQADKRANPSNYAMCTISEGAQMVEGQVIESGPEDAYGHRKLGGIGSITAEAIKRNTGEDVMSQQISYLMRSGAPDSLDLMVGFNFASLALQLIKAGLSGRMVALRDGNYTSIPIPEIMSGVKRVDVAEFYDVEQYLPRVRNLAGKPMFLY